MDVVVAMTLLVYRSAARMAPLEHGGEVAHFNIEVCLGRKKRRGEHGHDNRCACEQDNRWKVHRREEGAAGERSFPFPFPDPSIEIGKGKRQRPGRRAGSHSLF